MKYTLYYVTGFLLLALCASNICAKVTVKNNTQSRIDFRLITGAGNCMEDGGSLFSGSSTTRDSIANDPKCPLVKVTARLDKPKVNATPWEGNVTGNATFVVKPNGSNGYVVVKE